MKSDKKKIIVFASTFPRWKNDTNPPFVYELSKRLTDKFDIYVLTPNYPGAKEYEVMDKMKVHRFRYFFRKYETLAGSGGILPTLNKNKWNYFKVPFFLLGEYLALRRLVKKVNPHLIHAHWIIPQGFVAYFLNSFVKVPYVVTTHGGDIFGLQGKFLTNIKKKVLGKAKRISVVSNAIKREIEEKIDPSLKIEVIPMGVDSTLFNPNKKDPKLKKKYGITGPFLLFVGRLTEKKGVKYLIEAMPEVIKKNPKTKLMIVGTGELEKELKDLTEKINMKDKVIFTGAIPNSELPKYYATADIFIAPSIVANDGDREGLPVTLMEASASGTSIIASKFTSFEEKGVALINPLSKNSINLAIRNQIMNKNKVDYSKFDINFISKKYEEVLRK